MSDKTKAYRLVRLAKKAGTLKQECCVICHKPQTEAHHEDYSKPLQVIWYCKYHHRQRHMENGDWGKRPRKRKMDKLFPEVRAAIASGEKIKSIVYRLGITNDSIFQWLKKHNTSVAEIRSEKQAGPVSG